MLGATELIWVQLAGATSAWYRQPVVRGRRNPLHFGFAQRLRRARRAAGLSCAALARTAGLGSSTTIGTLEAHRTVAHVDTAERLARALGIAPGFLAFGGELRTGPGSSAGLGARLREVRLARGLAKQPLDQLADVAKGTVANTESGRSRPRIDTVEKIAKVLDVSASWLAFGAGSRDVPARSPRSQGSLPVG